MFRRPIFATALLMFCNVAAISASFEFVALGDVPYGPESDQQHKRFRGWPAPGSEDTELGVLMELEVGHGETEVHAGVQA
jgi:hypothetical protein